MKRLLGVDALLKTSKSEDGNVRLCFCLANIHLVDYETESVRVDLFYCFSFCNSKNERLRQNNGKNV